MDANLENAFAEHLHRWRDQPFVLGTADCVVFTVAWIDAQRGTHLTMQVEREWRGRPFRELRTLAQPGKLRAAVEAVIGPPDEGTQCKLGDVVMFNTAEGKEAIGVAGERLVYGPSNHGIGAVAQTGRLTAVWPLEWIG